MTLRDGGSGRSPSRSGMYASPAEAGAQVRDDFGDTAYPPSEPYPTGPRPSPGNPLRIQGYAAVFDAVDRAGDVFRAGAFEGALPVPLLWQHRGAPVGAVTAIGEDARGLWIEAAVSDPAVARMVRSGTLTGLSVGYRAVTARQGAWREITAAHLIEVSLVAQAMQPAARVEAIY